MFNPCRHFLTETATYSFTDHVINAHMHAEFSTVTNNTYTYKRTMVIALVMCNMCVKALLPVCMKYTVEMRVEQKLSSRAVYFIQMKWQCFRCFIVFTYYSVSKIQFFGHFNTFIE